MKHLKKISLLLVLNVSALMHTGAHSQSFFKKDSWDVTCDNNTICRAAGYQIENDYRPTSVLLEVDQGAEVPIVGYLNLLTPDGEVPSQPPIMFIGDKSHGRVALKRNISAAPPLDGPQVSPLGRIEQVSPFLLTRSQVDGLVGSAHRTEYVVFKSADHQWDLPTAGLSAVLLKIDDVQKRLGTTSALSKRGRGKDTYKASRKGIETIDQVTLDEYGLRLQDSELKGLQHYFKGSDCELFSGIGDISQTPLSATTAYLQAPCWLAAYNAGGTALLVRRTENGELRVTDAPDGEFENGKIRNSMKIRGLGDCWEISEWIWNGEALVLSLSLHTGQCRGFWGGAWSIPEIHYRVLPH